LSKRYTVFMAILHRSVALKRSDLLTDQFEHIESWAKDWQLNEAQLGALYAIAADIVAEDQLKSQSFKIEYLKRMTTHKERNSAKVTAVAKSVCLTAITLFKMDAPCCDCALIADVECVQDLKKDTTEGPLFELLTIFASKRVGDYIAFHKKHTKYLLANGVDHDDTMAKLRTLTLCSLGLEHESLSFTTLMEALHVPDVDAVESAIIDAVMTGRFEAKIDQEQDRVVVLRTTKRNFAEADWALLGDKLEMWQDNVARVLANLHNIQMPDQDQLDHEE